MSFRRGSLSSALELEVIGKPLVFDPSFYRYTFVKHFISPTQERLISFHPIQEWYEGHSLTISFCDENSEELSEKTRKLWKGKLSHAKMEFQLRKFIANLTFCMSPE